MEQLFMRCARRNDRLHFTLLIAFVLAFFAASKTNAQTECNPSTTSEIYFNTSANKLYSVVVGPTGNYISHSLKGTMRAPQVINGTGSYGANYGDIGFNTDGKLYAISQGSNNSLVVEIDPANAQDIGTPFTLAFTQPTGLTFDKFGNMYTNRSDNTNTALVTSQVYKRNASNLAGSGSIFVDFSNETPTAVGVAGPGNITDTRYGVDAGSEASHSTVVAQLGRGATLAGDILFTNGKAYMAVWVRTTASGATVTETNRFQLVEVQVDPSTNAFIAGTMKNISTSPGGFYLPYKTYGLAADAFGNIYAVNWTGGLYKINLSNGQSTLVHDFNSLLTGNEEVFGASGRAESQLDTRPQITSVVAGATTCSPLGSIIAQQYTINASHYSNAQLEYSFNGGTTWQDSNVGTVTTTNANLMARIKSPAGCAAANPVTSQVGQSCTPATDTDGDGIIDSIDIDDDNDGITDIEEGYNASGTSKDTDGDGKPDYLDLDSDNDGISDLIESGNSGSLTADTNGDGYFSSADTGFGTGVGANGLLNSIENNDTTSATTAVAKDTDGDGVKDFRDLDSDNDGINDIRESGIAGLVDANNDGTVDGPDADGDGIRDSADSNDSGFGGATPNASIKDTDGDGIKDFRDLDSDNDGLNDIRESGLPATADANNDGIVDGNDTDGDGIRDAADGNTGAWGDASDPSPKDTDNDGVADYRDLDSDNDGINDVRESGLPASADANGDGTLDGADTDGDGIKNSADGNSSFGDSGDPLPKDSDGDSVPDFRDLDSDNDGINDVRESGLPATADGNNDGVVDGTDTDGDGIVGVADGNTSVWGDASDPTPRDTDGDGVADYRDLDSDNDGVNDIKESGLPASADTDGDGKVNGADTDGDGILGVADGTPNTWGDSGDPAPKDTDGDNVPDYRDLDSDNDGINDVTEAGGSDPDGNGQVGSGNPTVDPNNGLPTTGGSLTPKDTDGDSVPDMTDLDSDNDGINDVKESGLPATADADGDGKVDGTDPDGDGILGIADGTPSAWGDTPTTDSPAAPKDTDGDGVPDYKDLDSDNDGINDVKESGLPATADANGDGKVDGTDADGDGILGIADGTPNNWGDSPTTNSPKDPKDTDGDSVPDYRDLDADNDGVNDLIESGLPAGTDANGDGRVDGNDPDADGIVGVADGNPNTWGDLPTATSPTDPKDTDGDSVPDYRDLDADNDGVNDVIESGLPAGTDANGDGRVDGNDPDADGIVGVADGNPNTWGDLPTATSPTDPKDTDGDTVPDYRDLDSDNDGINDVTESGLPAGTDANGDGEVDGADPDGDGILGVADGTPNAWGDTPTTTSPNVPKDSDGDGVPNINDLDSDNDGINDFIENGGNPANDTNNDGKIDFTNPATNDPDGDGILNPADGTPNTWGDSSDPGSKDTDGDGIPNANDLDSDNDGINDVIEAGGSDPDGNGQIGTGTPTVNPVTGIPTGGSLTPPDTDSDGASNPYDLDSDNDGISDLRENGDPAAITGDANNDGTIDIVSGGDPDGDGIQNPADGTPNTWGDSGSPQPVDTDSDGTPDYKDLDSNNDGIHDIDTTPYSGQDANNDGKIDDPTDADKDGIADVVDTKDNEFGGLPYVAQIPDLRPIIVMANGGFIKPSALTRPAELRIYNVGQLGSTTNDLITVYIYPPSPAFSLTLSNSPDWNMTHDAGGNYYTLTSNVAVPQGTSGFKAINLQVTAAGSVPKGKYNMTFEIGDTSGGEVNNANNTVSQELVVSGN